MLLDSAQVARLSDLPASALRYYEHRGLIVSVGRRGLRRLFDPAVLHLLDAISLARWAGFSLDEIQRWIGKGGQMSADRAALRRRTDEVAALSHRLDKLSRMLRHTADCPAEDHFARPTFRRMLAAARRQRPASGPASGATPALPPVPARRSPTAQRPERKTR